MITLRRNKQFTVWTRNRRADFEPFISEDPFAPTALYMWGWSGDQRVIIATLYKDGDIFFAGTSYRPR